MINKTYSNYKVSNEPWLGEIPSHWDLKKTKFLFKERVEKGYPNEPLLAATQTKGVVPKSHYENRTVLALKDLHLLKLVKKGDFVISLRSFQGGIELAYFQGIISPAYTIMIPGQEIKEGYFKYLAKSKVFIRLLETCVTGIREGQNIDYEQLKRKLLPIPSLEEQTQIARYLDWKTAQINKFIKAKKRMIELLKEKKQAIINNAVTGQIDVKTGKPYPHYKDSGKEWLGKIPDSWEIRSLKNIGHGIIGLTYSPGDLTDESGNLVLRSSNIKEGRIINKDNVYVKKVIPLKLVTRENDILICSRNGSKKLIGKSALINNEFIGATFGVFMSIFRSPINDFVYLVLNSNIFNYLAASFSTSTINQLTLRSLHNLTIPLPNRDEQIEIIRYVKQECRVIDITIDEIEKELTLMQEYKIRIISDVVTGKVDLRGIRIQEINQDDILPLDSNEIEEVDESSENEELAYATD